VKDYDFKKFVTQARIQKEKYEKTSGYKISPRDTQNALAKRKGGSDQSSLWFGCPWTSTLAFMLCQSCSHQAIIAIVVCG
jgi:hypothetical protein